MQLLANGRDQVAESYMEGSLTLHRLVDGTYQFGTGKTASVVSSVEQVSKFHEQVQTKVKQWLDGGGYERGIQAKKNLDLAESSKAMPGSIEALADSLGGQDLLGKIYAVLQSASKGNLTQPGPAIPANVLRPDRSVKVVIPDDDEIPVDDDLSDVLPDLSMEHEEPLGRINAQLDPPTPAPQAPEVMASLNALAEGMGAIMDRLEKLESKPKAAAKPRPNRSKHSAAKKAKAQAPPE